MVSRLWCSVGLSSHGERVNTSVWTNDGFSNFDVSSVSVLRHEKSQYHIRTSIELSTVGWTRLDHQLNR